MLDTNPTESEVKEAVSVIAIAAVEKGFRLFQSVTELFDRLGNTTAIENPYMDKQEVADYLKRSIRTVENWMKEKKIPFQKSEGRVVFKRIEVERFARQLE